MLLSRQKASGGDCAKDAGRPQAGNGFPVAATWWLAMAVAMAMAMAMAMAALSRWPDAASRG
jgi:hypothetical protein